MSKDIISQNYNLNDEEMQQMYNADVSTKADVWYFNPDAYVDTSNSFAGMCSAINAQVAIAQNARNSVSGNMKSPEGKDIEGSIGSCFDDIISGGQSVTAGIGYIMTWAFKRYMNGVKAGLISMNTVNSIPNTFLKIFTDVTFKLQGELRKEQQKLKKIQELQKLQELKEKKKIQKLQKIIAKTNPGTGMGSIDRNGVSMYKSDTYLSTMEKCWNKLFENGRNIEYGTVGCIIPYDWSAEGWDPNNQGYTDCSSFVSWTLYEYGYEEFKGKQHCTWDYTNQGNLDRWAKDYNWNISTAINSEEASKMVKAGDIVVFDGPPNNPTDGHMFIVKEKKSDGTIITLDAGAKFHWTDSGSPEGTTSGYFSNNNEVSQRECKIISIEDVSSKDANFLKDAKSNAGNEKNDISGKMDESNLNNSNLVDNTKVAETTKTDVKDNETTSKGIDDNKTKGVGTTKVDVRNNETSSKGIDDSKTKGVGTTKTDVKEDEIGIKTVKNNNMPDGTSKANLKNKNEETKGIGNDKKKEDE